MFVDLWFLLFSVILTVLIYISVFLLESLPALAILLMFVSLAAFVVALVWVSLRYALVDFLIADQGLTGLNAIRESKRLIRGNGRKLVVLWLSFLGWQLLETAVLLVGFVPLLVSAVSAAANPSADILAIATAALGSIALLVVLLIAVSIFNLWLNPYITGAEALFYDYVRGAGSAAAFPGGNGGYTWTPGPQNDARPTGTPKDTPWE